MLSSSQLQDIQQRLTFGMPLTMQETRDLFEMATGVGIKTKKRCQECNATGKTEKLVVEFCPDGEQRHSSTSVKCHDCDGSGYQ